MSKSQSARNTSVALGDHFAGFIEEQVTSGRFATASEVVRAGLRLLEEREARLRELRAAIAAGDASGESRPYDREAFLAARRRQD